MNHPDTDNPASGFESMLSLKHWGEPPDAECVAREVHVDCGWGRLLFGQTFESASKLAAELEREGPGRRDVALYVREPHVVLSEAPLALFLDPSHTYRLVLGPRAAAPEDGLVVRAARPADEAEINRLYLARGMVPLDAGYLDEAGPPPAVNVLVVPAPGGSGRLDGVVMGVDHHEAFGDPDGGSSLWALAVDPQARLPGVGETLVRALAALFRERGRRFMDLSVMHDNEHAIALYEKLGFERAPVYCVKRKNSINEDLFIGTVDDVEGLNPYARIIVDEARRRGIESRIDDAEAGLFTLSLGGRSIACRESLSEFTSAVALARCDDKALTSRLLAAAGLAVPRQVAVREPEDALRLLAEVGRIVVKPARGEQGRGVHVDLRDEDSVRAAVDAARTCCDEVIAEHCVEGRDLRVIVIDREVVAAAERRPAAVTGDGAHTVRELIAAQSRRREAATGGESSIPLDRETERCVAAGGLGLDDVPPRGREVRVRREANLHCGGTIHDVTATLHPALADAAVRAAEALDIPVVGLDLLVPDPGAPEYVIVEANERPGLANHEPQPTAERFVDFLFPTTRRDPETARAL